jgi:predicted nucleic acid-binding protein
MYLIDTNIVCEIRKGEQANPGVKQFFAHAMQDDRPLYMSAVCIGELRRSVDLLYQSGDTNDAVILESWLNELTKEYQDYILDIDGEVAMLCGNLSIPNSEQTLDMSIAATALIYDLILVTGTPNHYQNTGARLLNPFIT